jgi:hypothetical protein
MHFLESSFLAFICTSVHEHTSHQAVTPSTPVKCPVSYEHTSHQAVTPSTPVKCPVSINQTPTTYSLSELP